MVSWITSIRPESCLVPLAWDCHGPVNDEAVDVADLEVFQGGLEVGSHMLGPVVAVPKL